MNITKDFTKAPNALYTLYTRLPDFKAEHAMAYIILTSYYNTEYGYAFPTQQDLALRLNVGINKPASITKVLEKYGLVKRERRGTKGNYVYFVNLPVDNEAEFYANFPQAKAHYEERVAMLDERKEASELAREQHDAKLAADTVDKEVTVTPTIQDALTQTAQTNLVDYGSIEW